MANEFIVRKGLIVASGSISGSHDSTGSFGRVEADTISVTSITASSGALSGDMTFDDITASGNIISTGVNKVISGSSTSTGSFGSLVVADKVQGNLTIGSQNTAATQYVITTEALSGPSLVKIYSGHSGTNRLVGIHMSASTAGADYSIGLDRATDSFTIRRGAVGGTEIVNVSSSRMTVTGDTLVSGNISGSATSTGSFGELHIDDKVAIGGTSLNAGSGSNLTLMVDGGANTTASIGPMTYGNGNPSLWLTEGVVNGDMLNGMVVRMDGGNNYGAIDFRSSPDNVTYTTITAIKMARAGTAVEFPTANVKVSGSATSTGSFGAVGIGTGSPDEELHVYGTIKTSTNSDSLVFASPSTSKYVMGLYGGNDLLIKDSSGNLHMSIFNDTGNIEFPAASNISGSATSTGSFGRVHIQQSTLTTAQNTDVDIGTEEIAGFPTGSLTGAFFDYVVSSGSSNMRAGTVMSVWDGTNIEHTDTSTNDIGNTTDLKLGVALTSSMAVLRATAASDNWSVKTLVRTI